MEYCIISDTMEHRSCQLQYGATTVNLEKSKSAEPVYNH